MTAKEHLDLIHRLARRDGRYATDAFLFVSEAIGQTGEWLRNGELTPLDRGGSRGEGTEFHVSGQELLMGIRRLARLRWGLMARRVLASWGVHRNEDFGEIVFLMVEDSDLQWRKRECDSRADFAGGVDFADAFDSWD